MHIARQARQFYPIVQIKRHHAVLRRLQNAISLERWLTEWPDYIYETSTKYNTVTETDLVQETTTSFATVTVPLPTTIVQLSTIFVPPPASAAPLPLPSLSAELSIRLPPLPPATVTVYSNISVPYLSTILEFSTILQPTTIVDISTIYVPLPTTLVQLSSIFVPQPTTIVETSSIFVPLSFQAPNTQLSTACYPIVTTVLQMVTLSPVPSTTTLVLPQATVTTVERSTDYIVRTETDYVYDTTTQFITGESHFLEASVGSLREMYSCPEYQLTFSCRICSPYDDSVSTRLVYHIDTKPDCHLFPTSIYAYKYACAPRARLNIFADCPCYIIVASHDDIQHFHPTAVDLYSLPDDHSACIDCYKHYHASCQHSVYHAHGQSRTNPCGPSCLGRHYSTCGSMGQRRNPNSSCRDQDCHCYINPPWRDSDFYCVSAWYNSRTDDLAHPFPHRNCRHHST